MTTPEVRAAAVAALADVLHECGFIGDKVIADLYGQPHALLDALLASPDRARALVAALAESAGLADAIVDGWAACWDRKASPNDIAAAILRALTEADTRSEP